MTKEEIARQFDCACKCIGACIEEWAKAELVPELCRDALIWKAALMSVGIFTVDNDLPRGMAYAEPIIAELATILKNTIKKWAADKALKIAKPELDTDKP